jgi:hypothetical protein
MLIPSRAWADIGQKWFGDVAREPRGLKGIDITREKLTIDLRPLRDGKPVAVEMIYYLRNNDGPKNLDLVFVSGSPVMKDFEVRLDARLVESTPMPIEERSKYWDGLPESWKPPANLPGLDRNVSLYCIECRPSAPTLLTFSVQLPPGVSTLSARYRARAAGADEGYPTTTWQFPYILAPAREWGSFGGLEVTVYLPEGWQAASAPALEREGDLLRGRFDELPADTIVIATRMPVGPGFGRAIYVWCGVYALIVIAGGLLCWWIGRQFGQVLARRMAAGAKGWGGFGFRVALAAVVLPMIWAAAIFQAAPAATKAIHTTLAGQESPYFQGHLFGPLCGSLFLVMIVLPVGVLFIAQGANSGRRRGRARNEQASGRQGGPSAEPGSPAATRLA